MRVAYITDFVLGQYYGGGEKRYFEVWKRLVKKGYDIDVYCMKSTRKAIQYPQGVNIKHIGPIITNPPDRSMWQMLYFVVSSFLHLINKKYDVYEAQGVGILSLYLLKLVGKKNTISLIHDLSSGDKDQWISKGRFSEFFEKFIYKLPTHKVITVSNNIKKRLVNEYKINEHKINVIYNGIDLELIDSVVGGERKGIIYLGRLIPHKHVDNLLDVVKNIPNLYLKIIGDGPEKNKLEKITDNLKISDRVNFLGTLKDYKDVIVNIKKSKILVLPSTREGFGLVLVEAMACGTPVVAYESDGASEVVKDGYNGILVGQRNIEELQNAIQNLLKNKDNWYNISNNCQSSVKNKFDWDKTKEELDNLYKQTNR